MQVVFLIDRALLGSFEEMYMMRKYLDIRISRQGMYFLNSCLEV